MSASTTLVALDINGACTNISYSSPTGRIGIRKFTPKGSRVIKKKFNFCGGKIYTVNSNPLQSGVENYEVKGGIYFSATNGCGVSPEEHDQMLNKIIVVSLGGCTIEVKAQNMVHNTNGELVKMLLDNFCGSIFRQQKFDLFCC